MVTHSRFMGQHLSFHDLTTEEGKRQVICDTRLYPGKEAKFSALNCIFKGCILQFLGTMLPPAPGNETPSMHATDFRLLKVCIPPSGGGPTAIAKILRAVNEEILPLEEACAALSCTPDDVHHTLGLMKAVDDDPEGKSARFELKEALLFRSRILCGLPATKPPGRLRPAQHTKKDMELLLKQETSTDLYPLHLKPDWGSETAAGAAIKEEDVGGEVVAPAEAAPPPPPLPPHPLDNLPGNLAAPRSPVDYGERRAPGASLPLPPRPERSRELYAATKKAPQIQWFLGALGRLLETLHGDDDIPTTTTTTTTIADVGGGRGDLALSIASAFPAVHVLVVDTNRPSLEAGEARAKELGLDRNTTFICGDALEGIGGEGGGSVLQSALSSARVFVGLHTCGGLTDLAMALAHRARASFLLVPCCYTKHGGLPGACVGGGLGGGVAPTSVAGTPEWEEGGHALLSRLAESPDARVAGRAARVINSRRAVAWEMGVKGGGPHPGGVMEGAGPFKVHLVEGFSQLASMKNVALIGCSAAHSGHLLA